MGNRKVAGKRCKIAFFWAMFLAFLTVPIFGDFTDVFATVEIIKGPGGSGESGGGNLVDCEARSKDEGYENFYLLEWTQDCAGASWIYYESTGDVNEAMNFSPYMSWHNKVIPYIKFNIPQGCSDTGFWHYGSNGYYNGVRAPWGRYYGFGNGAGWGHWQSYAYNVTGTSWIPYVLPPDLPNKYPNFNFGIFANNALNHVIKNNDGVVAYRAKKYGTPDEVLKDLQNEQILAGDEPEPSLDGIAGFCSHGGMMMLDAFTVDDAGNYINTSGNSTNEAGARISGMPKSVKKNEQGGTISAPDIVGYKFIGWRQNRTTGATGGTQSNYNVGIMDVDRTFYAVYKKNKTLTLKSCDSRGNSLAGVDGLRDSSVTVNYGGLASRTRGLDISQGYTAATFKGFVATAMSCQDAKTKNKIATTNSSSPIYVSGGSSETINVKSLTADATIYAIYELPDLTLTRNSVDTYGNSLDSIIPSVTKTAKYGEKVKVCRGSSSMIYKYWANSVLDAQNGIKLTNGLVEGENCYETTLTNSKTVYVVYDRAFEGKSNAKHGSSEVTTGWTSGEAAKRMVVQNCSPVSGCAVSISHDIKRVSGGGTTTWAVKRTSNYYDASGGFGAPSGNVGSNTSPGGRVATNSYKLLPGVVICETLSLYKNGTSTGGYAYTTVCVSATGYAQPGNVALIDEKVKNRNLGDVYGDSVYAKPGDTVDFKTTYSPILQYTYSLYPDGMKIDNSSTFINSDSSKKTLGSFFNEKKSSRLGDWKNAFDLTCARFNCDRDYYSYTNGNATVKSETNGRLITMSDAGKRLTQTARTSSSSNTKTTPTQVGFTEIGNRNIANVTTLPIEDPASVIVPHNFILSTNIPDTTDRIVYAGETTPVKFNINVEAKENSLTGGTGDNKYATPVPGAKRAIEVNDGSGWTRSEWTDIVADDLNPLGGAKTLAGVSIMVDVADVRAGSNVCVRVVVWPQNSGADSNTDKDQFGGEALSNEACFTVAKKPSFQVWGGNLFVNGNATVPVSEKTLATGEKRIFGSWTELGLFGNKKIKGIASGATTGYSGLNLERNPGGIDKTDFCLRSVLSFANNNCNTGVVGNMAASGLTQSLSGLSNLVTNVAPGMRENVSSGRVLLGSDYGESTNGVRYSYSSGDLSIGGEVVDAGITHVVRSNKTITIDGNLEYINTTFSSLQQIPKLFIYAEDGINIECSVDRVDAVLITAGKINTCSNSDNVNNEQNSNQLKINGAIITKSIDLYRTYGAGTGNASMIPAEIINYDTTLYMWLFSDEVISDGSDSQAKFTEVYRQELAPRY